MEWDGVGSWEMSSLKTMTSGNVVYTSSDGLSLHKAKEISGQRHHTFTHTRESCRRHGDSIVMESPHHPVENVNFMLYYSSAEFGRQSDGNRRPRYRPCVCMYGNFPFKSECVHVFVAK